MPYYIICGKPDCANFNHATFVAHYLQTHLPHFRYRKIEKAQPEFNAFLRHLNKTNKWFLTKSPVIWKELSTWGGKPHLIGGLGEFWEHCFCYYGLESNIPKLDLEKLTKDNVMFFNKDLEETAEKNQTYFATIGILGATNWMVPYILEEFINLQEFQKPAGILFKLLDLDHALGKTNKKNCYDYIIEEFTEEINEARHFGSKKTAKFVQNYKELVEHTDLLFLVDDYPKHEHENGISHLCRLRELMSELANSLNYYGKRNIKIIVVNGPVCFLATCVVEFCLIVNVGSVVAVTSDLGLPVLKAIHEMTEVSVHQMSAPPVWGFVGLNNYVDEGNVIFKANIYRPYKRALTAPSQTTLPLGTYVPEIRLMSYMLPDHHDEITKMVDKHRKKTMEKLKRYPYRPKVRSLVSLMKIWYSEEDQDSIISLGIYSTGAFDIPSGLVFSQPAILDEKRRWKPFYAFPLISEITKEEIEKCVVETMEILENIGIDLVEEEIDFEDNSTLETTRSEDDWR